MPSYCIRFMSISIFTSRINSDLSSGPVSLAFPIVTFQAFLLTPIHATCPPDLDFGPSDNICGRQQITNPLTINALHCPVTFLKQSQISTRCILRMISRKQGGGGGLVPISGVRVANRRLVLPVPATSPQHTHCVLLQTISSETPLCSARTASCNCSTSRHSLLTFHVP